ncbi:MAG: hypothetical protein IJS28_01660 [Synergistaceae bacterium]|nr:hypothetical protein [Synergistaceae bacterium]
MNIVLYAGADKGILKFEWKNALDYAMMLPKTTSPNSKVANGSELASTP